ncbi:MAG: glycosyltransferase [Burkholderiales bacterium]
MTTVTVVVPAHNHADYLGQAIESVLAQTYPDVELIVLDDGSTDETRDVLSRFRGRFHFESHPNMGQSATLNKGWAMARGEILGYLSADDVLYPQCVRRAVQTLQEDSAVVVSYCDFEKIDQRSARLGIVRTPEWRYADLVLEGECPPGPGAFFRRAAYLVTGGWNPAFRRVPDFEFWLRMGLQGEFRRIPEILAGYRVHDSAQSFSTAHPDRADEMISALEQFFLRSDLPPNIRSGARRAKANALLHSARLHMYSGRVSTGWARTTSALATDPSVVLQLRTYRRVFGGLLKAPGRGILWRLRTRH